MKFWTKVYFSVLILFLLVFNLSICWIIYVTQQYMLNAERDKAAEQNYFIKQNLESDMTSLNDNNMLSSDTIRNLMNYYGNYSKEKVFFLLLQNNKQIFSNLYFNKNAVDIRILSVRSGQKAEIIEQNNSKYVLIAENISSLKDKYVLVGCYKLDGVIEVFSKLQGVYIFTSFIISCILAILLAIMIKMSSKPLKQLIIFVNQIKNGQYGIKLKVHGKDEFAMLENNFNEMSEKISRNVQQLNRYMKKKQLFIDNLAHELRTPLTSIYGYAEYIQKAAISEEDKYEATKYIMEESKRLQYMANRLLDITIRRSSDIVVSKINVDVLLEKAVRTVEPALNRKSITANINNGLFFINGEMELIESVLVNLLDNAIKASEENQFIYISVFPTDEGNVIQIKDSGKGISKEHIDHLTEPFYRTDKARSRAEGGVGLGLAICKQIMDMHRGIIKIDSEINKGTTVRLIFTTS